MTDEPQRGPHPDWPIEAQRDWYARECAILRNKLCDAHAAKLAADQRAHDAGRLAFQVQCKLDELKKSARE